jgi:hypothetical protein
VSLSPFNASVVRQRLHVLAHGSGCIYVRMWQRLASFVLAVETDELGIAAGLQDRVAQVCAGETPHVAHSLLVP